MNPSPPVGSTRVRVRSYELDGFGHANHAVFLNWFEHARFETLREGGFPLRALAERGWGVHVVRIEVDYRREALLGDELVVETHLEEVRRTSMTLHQVARSQAGQAEPEAVLAEARVVAVWVDEDGRPMRVPEEVRRALGPPAT